MLQNGQNENMQVGVKRGAVGQQATRRPFQDVANLNQGSAKDPKLAGGECPVPSHGYATRHKVNVLRQSQGNYGEGGVSWSELMERRADEGSRMSSVSSSRVEALPDIDAQDRQNPLAASDYVNDIVNYHRRVEPLYQPPADYIRQQPDINEKMRAILVDWLVEVHLKFKLMPETLFLTASCIDRFLAKKQVSRKNLQLVGVTAMLIASKYEEIWAPEVRDFVYISDKAYTRDQILAMEKGMLNTLGFHLTVPTPFLFLSRFLKAAKQSDKDTAFLAQYLIELALVDYNMVKYSGSLLAAASLFVAHRCQMKEGWNNVLERHTRYSAADLAQCASDLSKLQKKASSASLAAVFKKFSNAKFNEVAKIEHDDDLIVA